MVGLFQLGHSKSARAAKYPAEDTNSGANETQHVQRAVDPILLHNFLAETTQISGCTCTFCKLRDEPAQISSSSSAVNTPPICNAREANSNSDPDRSFDSNQNTSSDAPRAGVEVQNQLLTDDHRLEEIYSQLVSPLNDTRHHLSSSGTGAVGGGQAVPETPDAPLESSRNVQNVGEIISVEHAGRVASPFNSARYHQRRLQDNTQPDDIAAISLFNELPGGLRGLGIVFPSHQAPVTLAIPTNHPTLSSRPTISLNSPPSQSTPYIHSPDPQAYNQYGRLHPNFDTHSRPRSSSVPHAHLFSPHVHHRHRQPRYTNSIRPNYRQPPNYRAHNVGVPNDPPPAYVENYLDLAPMDELPRYSAVDPLLVHRRGHRHRHAHGMQGHYRRPPYVHGFQEMAPTNLAPSQSSSSSGSSENGGLPTFSKFVASLMRSTTRCLSLRVMDVTRVRRMSSQVPSEGSSRE